MCLCVCVCKILCVGVVGETIEETLRREIAEEVGLELESLRVAGSQHWPFPQSSFMVACHATVAPSNTQVSLPLPVSVCVCVCLCLQLIPGGTPEDMVEEDSCP